MKYEALKGSSFRLSVYVGEVSAACCRDRYDYGELEGSHPAPYGTIALRDLGSKEKAKASLLATAECAIGMAENIDNWW